MVSYHEALPSVALVGSSGCRRCMASGAPPFLQRVALCAGEIADFGLLSALSLPPWPKVSGFAMSFATYAGCPAYCSVGVCVFFPVGPVFDHLLFAKGIDIGVLLHLPAMGHTCA